MKSILKSVAFLFAIVAIGISVQSCNSVKPIDKTQLSGYWVLKTLEGKDTKTLFEGPTPSIQFDFEKNLVNGTGGCNNYHGGFTLTPENQFSAPNLAMTMMMCMHKNAEGEFTKLLSTPNLVLSIDKDGLLTFTQGDKVILQFEKGEDKSSVQAITNEALVGSWTLATIADGDVAKLFTFKTPTMEFDAEGKVVGNAGCNSYRSSVTLTDNTVTFEPLMTTRMACPSLEGETKFTTLLSTPLQATIDGEVLSFLKDGNVVLTFTKTAVSE